MIDTDKYEERTEGKWIADGEYECYYCWEKNEEMIE